MKERAIAEAFERIAEEAISAAEQVSCSMERFVEGLKDIEIAIRDRRHVSEDEVRRGQ